MTRSRAVADVPRWLVVALCALLFAGAAFVGGETYAQFSDRAEIDAGTIEIADVNAAFFACSDCHRSGVVDRLPTRANAANPDGPGGGWSP